MNRLLGEIIRQKIREDGRTAKSVCEELGMSRGNLDKIYHKNSVNSDLLGRICLILEYDFFRHVNPYRQGELRGKRHIYFSQVEEESVYNTANTKLRDAVQKLDRYQQELNYLRVSVADIKGNLSDKDDIIDLQKGIIENAKKQTEAQIVTIDEQGSKITDLMDQLEKTEKKLRKLQQSKS